MKGCFTIQKNKKICSIIVLILALIAFVGLAIVAIVAPMQYGKPVAGAEENDFTFPKLSAMAQMDSPLTHRHNLLQD